ncbi:hypothetical protein [Acinetobacter sp.]|uniref:hypothetical protein n=1 Tax=Acinetobacter sp. TaxID=472 RepID=UPI00389034A5
MFDIYNFRYRNLTSGEINLSRQIFGDLINYNEVKIFNIKYLPWQPINMYMAPNGNLFMNDENFCEDFSKKSKPMQGLFIHEMTHIYQYQSHINVLLQGALLQSKYFLSFKKYNPYKYDFIKDKPFNTYNIEQQGEIARDILFNRIPNIILNPQINIQ